MERILSLTLILSFCLALLAGASLIPDPCDVGGDDCCPTPSSAPTCPTVCCNGVLAGPVDVFILAPPADRAVEATTVEYSPVFIPSEPPDRPPAAA